MRLSALAVRLALGGFTATALIDAGCSSDDAVDNNDAASGDAATNGDASLRSESGGGPIADGEGGGADGAAADSGAHCDGAVGCDRVVFVSSLNVTGDLNGLAGADDLCNALASASKLARVKGTTFVAWLSDGAQTASVRLVHDGRVFVRTDGAEVARGWDDLVDGALPVPLVYDENGELAHQSTRAWTGTTKDGLASSGDNCAHWAAAAGTGGQGGIGRLNATWTADLGGDCANVAHIYCVEK